MEVWWGRGKVRGGKGWCLSAVRGEGGGYTGLHMVRQQKWQVDRMEAGAGGQGGRGGSSQ